MRIRICIKKRMFAWNLTAKTIMSDKEWKKFLKLIHIMEIIGLFLKQKKTFRII